MKPARRPGPPGVMAFDRPDRREVFGLIDRLPERDRILWLMWCCDQASRNGMPVRVDHNTGLAREVYLDWMTLCMQYRLDELASRLELERRVRVSGEIRLVGIG